MTVGSDAVGDPAPLDHIVFATRDLAQTADWLRRTVGIEPDIGGSHVGLGTANRLCRLGDGAYLEVIGPDPSQPEPAQPRPFGLDDLDAAGVATWCVRTTGLPALVARMQAAGREVAGPLAMERVAPGGRLSWELLLPESTAGGIVPFAIDWGDTPHPSTSVAAAVELISVQGFHPDPQGVAADLALLGASLAVMAAPDPELRVEVRGPGGQVVLPVARYGVSPHR